MKYHIIKEFNKFGEVIIHDCRDRNGLDWQNENIVIWYHQYVKQWYVWEYPNKDIKINHCPLCGVRLDHYFVHKGGNSIN